MPKNTDTKKSQSIETFEDEIKIDEQPEVDPVQQADKL